MRRSVLSAGGRRRFVVLQSVVTPSPMGERSIMMSVSVCLCMCAFLSVIIFSQLHVRSSPNFFVRVTYGRGSILLWRRSDMLSISGFMDGVIFVDKPRLLDVATWQHRWRNICLV